MCFAITKKKNFSLKYCHNLAVQYLINRKKRDHQPNKMFIVAFLFVPSAEFLKRNPISKYPPHPLKNTITFKIQLLTSAFFFQQGKFSVTPTILATADHVSSAFKHDAASLWIENATSSNFYICLRELQNYDGLHEDIFVVREI